MGPPSTSAGRQATLQRNLTAPHEKPRLVTLRLAQPTREASSGVPDHLDRDQEAAVGITEALIVKLGTAATRALLQSWLKDAPLATLAGESTEILSSSLTDIVQRRRAERELKIAAEAVAAEAVAEAAAPQAPTQPSV